MNIQWLEYDFPSGRILGHFASNSPGLPVQRDNLGLMMDVDHHDGALFYVLNGAIVPRPETPIRLAYTQVSNTVILTGIPKGTLVRIDGMGEQQSHEMDEDDGTMRLTFTVKGSYLISWETFPARAFSATVEV